MILTNTALTPATLLSLLSDAAEEITLPSEYGSAGLERTIQVVNMETLRANVEELVKNDPKNLFGDLVGLTREEAQAYIDTRCNGDVSTRSYNNAGTKLPLVSTTTVLFEDGRETQALYERTGALRGTSGMITGKGLGIEYDLLVSVRDGKISEIIHYGE